MCLPDVRYEVYDGVARRTLGYAGSVVDDVLLAVLSVLVQLLQLLALVVEVLDKNKINK